MSFSRPILAQIVARLGEPRRFLQVLAGPRQVGKTTLARQALDTLASPRALSLRGHYATADGPTLQGGAWIASEWDRARRLLRDGPAVLVLDEVQKVSGWSEAVKSFWDEDSRTGADLRVLLLGSAPLLVQRGLGESLAGRFELLRVPHWSFPEMREAFGWDLDRYVHFGGYPGAAALVGDEERWASYILDALVETTVSRDVLLLVRVDKPALLRRLFEVACGHSAQVLSYTKMLGQLQDAGNVTTLAHYLDLLSQAGMVAGLPRFSGDVARRRGSIPKLQVFNNALASALARRRFEETRDDPERWGRLVESAVGAHLLNSSLGAGVEVSYWRDGNHEVDFVLRRGDRIAAIEVKSGRGGPVGGLEAFRRRFQPSACWIVGAGGVALGEFLERPAREWVG